MCEITATYFNSSVDTELHAKLRGESAGGELSRLQMETGQMRTRTSSSTLRTRNTKYSTNMVRPNMRLILQRQTAMETMTKRSMRKSSTMAQKRPLELTVTGSPLCNRMNKSHGTGRLQAETSGFCNYPDSCRVQRATEPVNLRCHSPHSDVKDVTAHRAGHSHVPQTFTGHNHAGYQVGDGRPCRQDGQTHDFLRDAHGLAHLLKTNGAHVTFLPPESRKMSE